MRIAVVCTLMSTNAVRSVIHQVPTKTDLFSLTDSVELNALIAQVLRVEEDIVLGFSISDQHANLSGFGSHPNVLLEIVLEEVVQSQA